MFFSCQIGFLSSSQRIKLSRKASTSQTLGGGMNLFSVFNFPLVSNFYTGRPIQKVTSVDSCGVFFSPGRRLYYCRFTVETYIDRRKDTPVCKCYNQMSLICDDLDFRLTNFPIKKKKLKYLSNVNSSRKEEEEAARSEWLEMAVVQELDFLFTSSAPAVKSGVRGELPCRNSQFSACFSCFGSC